MRDASDKVVEKIITYILCSVNFLSENHAIYETMLKHRTEKYMPPMTMWCTHIACWITKATDIHTEYVIPIAFPLQQCCKCSSVLCLHMQYLSCLTHLSAT